MEFWAHSGTPGDHGDWQPLSNHLRQVAGLAEDLGRPHGIGRTARLAGLLHDLGKYDHEVQRRIAGANIHVDHSTAGGAVLLSRAIRLDRLAAELVAYAILGHHAGLPDRLHGSEGRTASGASLNERLEGFKPGRLDPAWEAEVPLNLSGIFEEMRAKIAAPERAGWDLALLARMVFSCLVDADFRDTEAHYARIGQGPRRDRDWPDLPAIVPDLLARFDAYMAEKAVGTEDNDLNRLRRDILAHVRERAALPPGLFTLTVPTGGGKTLASLGFALDHARQHGHQRIVYAIPFTSIIDQTAAIFREVLGAEHVLEHHSATEDTQARTKNPDEAAGREKLRLAMEDWAAPVVVTTNVQIFESLFAARPSRARKLHNIAGSVIVLDEAQAIPRPLLEPCVRMIDALARHWGCTVVLCTATQPAFHKGRLALPLSEERELAPDPAGLAACLRRSRIERVGTMDDAALCEALAATPQGLVIVNTRRHALELFRAAEGLSGLFHLSTRQCAAHRRAILAEVKRRLTTGEPCRVIATSLVEAGVDLDFPRVWRAEAGLDQIVQAAGRCNREGKRSAEESLVTVFVPEGRDPPPEIVDLIGDMRRTLRPEDDLLAPATIERYFEEVYWRLCPKPELPCPDLDKHKVMDSFSFSLSDKSNFTNFAFRSVAERFRLIEDTMAPVVVPWDDTAQRAVDRLGAPEVSSGSLARDIQTYLVQVPPRVREALLRNGHVRFERPDFRGDQFAVLTPGGMNLYSEEVGLEWERVEELPGGGVV
jgi:CRISPR-associated endonuclease/helicase Cas3